ncbi:MAG: translation initiation factor IF-2 [Bacteroidetes bacterium]|nr:translation initiation factor IF-2 [Bacteroidota bacterium]
MSGKRLNKVAKEFNISIATIIDFLGTKGVKLDSNPNTKVEAEVLAILDEEFADDKTAKQASENVAISREKRESLSLKDVKKDKKSEDTEEEEEELPKPKRARPVAEKKEPVEEVKAEVEKVVEPVEKPRVTEGQAKVAVVGKIDLDALNQKTRPDKKKKVVEEEKKAEEVVPKKEEKPVVEAPKVVVPEQIETIKAKTERLTGPTVIGKIVLPVAKEKSNNELSEAERKKRKRIKKVNIEKQAAETAPRKGMPNKAGGKSRVDKPQVTEEEIQKEIKETLARLQGGGGKSKGSKLRREKRELFAQKREAELEREEQEKGILKLTEFVTVSELASMMSVSVNEVIAACMSLGIFASINQRLDAETIQIVAAEYGFETQFISAEVQESIKEDTDSPEDLQSRPPIVTVMGHVDHGKTSLLDYIRKANVISGEAGGITQHIGAYSVETSSGRHITFLDTPGHEAFTAMRARGAQVTDIAIIIVAADDDVMPQTKEAISHAQAAGVPMVFAINKIDKPGADPERIKQQLSQMNILVEDWGGKFQSQEISAKKGTNVDALLEKVLLEADILELKANPDKNAVGTVVEATLDKGRGYVTTLLVAAGTLHVGDFIVAGQHYGRVKAMHNERGQALKEAGPSTPVSILGFTGAPSAGDKFNVLSDEKEAKQIAAKREQLHREQGLRTQKHITLDEIGRRIAIGDFQELNIIVKGDVDGSIEALSDSLLKLSTPKIQVNIIHKGVGAISETDVTLASASNAIIVGFQVRPSATARKLAEKEEIDIRLYSVIYQAIEEVKTAMEGMLAPEYKEDIVGTAEVRETFDISKIGTIAGCFVTEGKILRGNEIRLIRDGIVIYTGHLGSLKRFKDDVKEVKNGYECGLNIDKFNDIKVGDTIESYQMVEVKSKL